MGDVLRSYSSFEGTNATTSLNSDVRVIAAGDERTPLLPREAVGPEPAVATSRSPLSGPRQWVGDLFSRLGSRDSTPVPPPSTQTDGRPKATHECECGVPESEPFLRRLRRMNTSFERRLSSPPIAPEVELRSLRDRLNFHFSDFHKKYTAYRKKPWKFVLQIVKIVLVSVQIGFFATSKAGVVKFLHDNQLAMDHLFVGKYPDLFTVDAVHERLVNLLDGYYHIQHRSIGAYDYAWSNGSTPPLELCVAYYKQGRVFAFNQSYIWNQDTVVECTPLTNTSQANNTEWIKTTFTSTTFDKIVSISSVLKFTTLFLNSYEEPACVAMNVTVLMDNTNHAGRIPLTVSLTALFLQCHGNTVKTLSDADRALGISLDLVIIVVATVATLLTLRSLLKTAMLARRIAVFLRKYSKHHLTMKEALKLFDFWHINSVIADSLVVTGTILKVAVELQGDVATRNQSEHFTVCSFLLGVGCLLIWVGALRFLSYFHGYNVLLVTVRCAFPNLMRFMLCSGILYLAFAFCGWVALGTYHEKFRTLTITSETLFSLLNGDDMFRTFELMPTKPLGPYIFSQVYLYIFISLFIYFVLSQFIALITETYTEVLHMKEEDYDHLNACGHILQLLEVNIDTASAAFLTDESRCSSPTQPEGSGLRANVPPPSPQPPAQTDSRPVALTIMSNTLRENPQTSANSRQNPQTSATSRQSPQTSSNSRHKSHHSSAKTNLKPPGQRVNAGSTPTPARTVPQADSSHHEHTHSGPAAAGNAATSLGAPSLSRAEVEVQQQRNSLPASSLRSRHPASPVRQIHDLTNLPVQK